MGLDRLPQKDWPDTPQMIEESRHISHGLQEDRVSNNAFLSRHFGYSECIDALPHNTPPTRNRSAAFTLESRYNLRRLFS